MGSLLALSTCRARAELALPLRRRACVTTASAANVYDDGPFAVAPMMDYTDRFLRYLLRRLSIRQTLYTEMVTANTIVHCGESELPRFLEHDGEREEPVVGALELGQALRVGVRPPPLDRDEAVRVVGLQRAVAVEEDGQALGRGRSVGHG